LYREALPVGPPIFEYLIAKIFRKKIIYDFDDAIWVSIASEANPKAAAIKCTWKVAKICKMSHIVTVGNQFLADYAKKYCSDVRIIPTVVNTNTKHNSLKNQTDTPLYIGWTGTYTNFYNLDKITSVLKELKKKYDFTFIIIADKDPKFENLEYVFKKWDVGTEIFDLLQMHIGVMPLQNTEIELGKCAFKAIQYMSLGIPAVVSPVGANCTVVQNGVDGFWAETDEDWYSKLELLIKDEAMRIAIGNAARKKIVEQYSVDATQGMFFNLFN
jgi:glycosyltransferase involved in cell wall biosynthesis